MANFSLVQHPAYDHVLHLTVRSLPSALMGNRFLASLSFLTLLLKKKNYIYTYCFFLMLLIIIRFRLCFCPNYPRKDVSFVSLSHHEVHDVSPSLSATKLLFMWFLVAFLPSLLVSTDYFLTLFLFPYLLVGILQWERFLLPYLFIYSTVNSGVFSDSESSTTVLLCSDCPKFVLWGPFQDVSCALLISSHGSLSTALLSGIARCSRCRLFFPSPSPGNLLFLQNPPSF